MVTAMGIIGALFGCAATIPDCLADRNLAGIQIGEDTARDVKKNSETLTAKWRRAPETV
jgi:hypothetical protein